MSTAIYTLFCVFIFHIHRDDIMRILRERRKKFSLIMRVHTISSRLNVVISCKQKQKKVSARAYNSPALIYTRVSSFQRYDSAILYKITQMESVNRNLRQPVSLSLSSVCVCIYIYRARESIYIFSSTLAAAVHYILYLLLRCTKAKRQLAFPKRPGPDFTPLSVCGFDCFRCCDAHIHYTVRDAKGRVRTFSLLY